MLLGFHGGANVDYDIEHIFANVNEVPKTEIQRIIGNGHVPLVTVEPWSKPSGRVMDEWNATLKKLKSPTKIYLRYGHEFNIPQHYPWSNWGPVTFKREFIAFSNAVTRGLPEVQMIWSPNVRYHGSLPIKSWYPGHNYVDIIGIDGYNGTQPDGRWRMPPEIFDPGYTELLAIQYSGTKPWWITETGCRERSNENRDPSTRKEWLGSLMMSAKNNGVSAIVYFNIDKEQKWRLDLDEQRHLRTLVSGGYPAKNVGVQQAPEEEQAEVDPRHPTPQLPRHPLGSTGEWLERVTGRRWGRRG